MFAEVVFFLAKLLKTALLLLSALSADGQMSAFSVSQLLSTLSFFSSIALSLTLICANQLVSRRCLYPLLALLYCPIALFLFHFNLISNIRSSFGGSAAADAAAAVVWGLAVSSGTICVCGLISGVGGGGGGGGGDHCCKVLCAHNRLREAQCLVY